MNIHDLIQALPELRTSTAETLCSDIATAIRTEELDLALIPKSNADTTNANQEFDYFDANGHRVFFRKGFSAAMELRRLFVQRVIFAGAAPSRGMCTVEALEALNQADVCLHDVLFDDTILNELPEDATVIHVGKRCGAHAIRQPEINQLLLDYARQGKRVVRLKAGDPGIFGRLCEETDTLSAHELPFKVQAAVSSLSVATTATGILLTRRGSHRGFTVMTPRCAGGETRSFDPTARDMPVILFMASHIVRQSLEDLNQHGIATDTPAAIIYDAGCPQQSIVCGTVATLADIVEQMPPRTGLLYVGHGADTHWPNWRDSENLQPEDFSQAIAAIKQQLPTKEACLA
ncbi:MULTISPECIES: SAM-dependent methyltransferase [unclassified Lentimonas]|uniref:SAM-dependent methyltransferase n=1 Tax=unclassified Lentimonas TaxID=2630993 RepID=UPI00132542E4|nr:MULTISPECIES: SAM-dependent methyltransferase [unclassified Lentimonas]CAA6691580.1 Unannotated [Lentimonas sp. CC10]CAA6696247.1 Unannotated [Lentimonas sp. CC19]CAA7070863.1 Unannotated [Lentimonas sp. CC11]